MALRAGLQRALRTQNRLWLGQGCDRRKRRSGHFLRLTVHQEDRADKLTALSGRRKGFQQRTDYGFASGAASTALQAAGNEAIVIGGFGFGGVFGGLGWRTESLNQ
jgi:hypothetical protein